MTPEPIMTGLAKGEDLVAFITGLCVANNITKASVQVIGALERARVSVYLQDKREYVEIAYDQPMEILAAPGSVSLKDGKPIVHLHLCLGDMQGRAYGGHATAGNIIFAGEVLITPLPGAPLVRGYDEATGLPLWTKI